MKPAVRDVLRALRGALLLLALGGGACWSIEKFVGPMPMVNTEGGGSDANPDDGEDGQRLRAGTAGVQERLRREQQ